MHILFVCAPALAGAQTNFDLKIQQSGESVHIESHTMQKKSLKYFDGYLYYFDYDGKLMRLDPNQSKPKPEEFKEAFSISKKGLFKKEKKSPIRNASDFSIIDSCMAIFSSNAIWYYSPSNDLANVELVAKDESLVDYREDYDRQWDMLTFTCKACSPNGLFASDSLVILSLRNEPYLSLKLRKKRDTMEVVRHMFYRWDSLGLMPELPQLCIAAIPTPQEVCNWPEKKQNKFWDKKGIKPVFLGGTDPIFIETYRKEGRFYPMGTKIAFDFEPKRNLVYMNYLALPKITALDLSGDTVAVFGEKGRHLKPSHQPRLMSIKEATGGDYAGLAKYKNVNRVRNKIFAAWAASPEYRQVKINAEAGLLYRTYRAPENMRDLDSLAELSETDEDAYYNLVFDKPTYLQVYDLNDGNKLIYDGPVPAPFWIAGIDETGAIWAITRWREDHVEVSKYEIER